MSLSLRLVELGRLLKERVPDYGLEELMLVWAGVLKKGCVEARDNESQWSDAELVAFRELGIRYVPISSEGRCVKIEDLGFYDEVMGVRERVFESTEELLVRGWPTPLVRLRSLSGDGFTVWAKLEWYNPFSFSVKDRVGWYMIKKLLEKGQAPRKVFEATSTNAGMALAAMGAIHGFSTRLYIPEGIQKASDILLRAMGAEVVRTGKSLTVESVEEVRKAAEEEGAVHTNQFMNDANFMVHVRYTAKELDYQLVSKGISVRGVVGGLGTSGHLSAIAFYLKNRYGGVRVVGVQPARGEKIPGIRRVETGMKWFGLVGIDAVVDVTLAASIEAVLAIARGDGILPGLSSGAVAAAFTSLRDSGDLEPGDYVLIFPDNGLKYVEQLSKYFEGVLGGE